MAEMMAFNRRHAQRSAAGSMDMHHYDAALPGHSAASASAPRTGEHGTVTMLVAAAPRSNSKKRRAMKTSSSPAPLSLSGGERKMSSAQLRLFFLLCVAVYFTVICFADDIVRFAKWVSDDDPERAWQQAPPAATLKTPVTSKGPTPKPAVPPKETKGENATVVKRAEDEKKKEKGVKEMDEETRKNKEGKHLRGEEKTTAPETSSPILKFMAPAPSETYAKATLAPQPTAKDEIRKKTTQDAQEDGTKKDPSVPTPPTAATLALEENTTREKLPQPTSLVVNAKPTANKEEDAPLDSVDNGGGGGHTKRKETVAAPAEIPQLGLAPTEDEEGKSVRPVSTVVQVTPTT